jgi:hypothetical protein
MQDLSILDPLVRRIRFQRLYLRLWEISESASESSRAAALVVWSHAAYCCSMGVVYV